VSVPRDIVRFAVLSLFWGCGVGRDVVLGELPFGDANPGNGDSSADGNAVSDTGPFSDTTLREAGTDAGFCASGEPVPAAKLALLSDPGRLGFGAFATGGSSGCVYHVEHLGESGPGSLRWGAESTEPLWIVFDKSGDGDIVLTSPIAFGSNKTVDGRGARITVRNFGFTISAGDSNVIIENLTFVGDMQGSEKDAIQIADAARTIWIDHCSFSAYGDGLVDITNMATEVTVSWSVFSAHDLAVLIGGSPSQTDDASIQVTLHHNWWNQTGNYAPRLRFGKAHVLNNLIENWKTAASAVTMGGEIYSEGNIFNAGNDKQALSTMAGNDKERGRAKSVGDSFQNGALKDETGAELVFLPRDYYSYPPAHAADLILQADIMANAGARPP